MKGLWARLSGRNGEKNVEKKAAKEWQAMLDAEYGLNNQLNKPQLAHVSELRYKIKDAIGPEGVRLRTDLASQANGDVTKYLGSLEEEYGNIKKLEEALLSKTNKVYNADERRALLAGEYKLHEQSGGRTRSRYSRRRRKTKKRKPKTRKRKRSWRKRRSR